MTLKSTTGASTLCLALSLSTGPGINRSIHTTLSRGYCYFLLTEETEAERPSHLLAPILTRAVWLQNPVFSPRSTSAERGEMVSPRTLIPGADSGYWSTWVCLCLDKPRQLRRSRTRLVGARGVCLLALVQDPPWGARRMGPPPPSPDP